MPPQRNGFFVFVLELRDKNPGKYNNIKEATEDAGRIWEKMDGPQRQPYIEKAKREKGKPIKKYTNLGQDIEVVQRREKEKVIKVKSMESTVEEIITSAKNAGTLEDEIFYVAHVNYFCYYEATNCYYPAEIAIGKFSLCSGITPENMFHMIIKPGPLPLGYYFTAFEYSQQTHQIDPPDGQYVDNNLITVLESLMTFMADSDNQDCPYPPIYASQETLKIVDNVLLNLCYEYGAENNLFKVYSLDYMLFTLRNTVANNQVWSRSYATIKLNEEMYIFAPNIPCPYHEKSDVPNRCSRSNVFCYIYIICDNCCKDLGIDLIPGKHVPINAKIENVIQTMDLPSTSVSFERSKKYNISDNLSYASSEMSDFVSIPDPCDYQTLNTYNNEHEAGASAWIEVKHKNKKEKDATVDLDLAMGSMSINNRNGGVSVSKNTSRGRGSRLGQALLKRQ